MIFFFDYDKFFNRRKGGHVVNGELIDENSDYFRDKLKSGIDGALMVRLKSGYFLWDTTCLARKMSNRCMK